jgi:hypothetical protein
MRLTALDLRLAIGLFGWVSRVCTERLPSPKGFIQGLAYWYQDKI